MNSGWRRWRVTSRTPSCQPNLPALAVDPLGAGVVELLVEAEARRAGVGPVVAEAGQRAGELAHVALACSRGRRRGRTAPAARARSSRSTSQRLFDVPLSHSSIAGSLRDVERELLEVAERVPAQQRVLAQHQPLRDAGLGGREPVVPDERHPLDQRRLRADHAVQPPQVVVAPRVARRERPAVDARARARRAASTSGASATGRRRAGRASRAPPPGRAQDRTRRATAAAPPALHRRTPCTSKSPRPSASAASPELQWVVRQETQTGRLRPRHPQAYGRIEPVHATFAALLGLALFPATARTATFADPGAKVFTLARGQVTAVAALPGGDVVYASGGRIERLTADGHRFRVRADGADALAAESATTSCACRVRARHRPGGRAHRRAHPASGAAGGPGGRRAHRARRRDRGRCDV